MGLVPLYEKILESLLPLFQLSAMRGYKKIAIYKPGSDFSPDAVLLVP